MRSGMVVYGLLFAGLVLEVPVAGAGETRPAAPKGRPGTAISIDDYPDASLRQGEQGMTTVEYEVNEAGSVTPGSCVVKATSDYPRLDRQTCKIVESRFRFEPALENGVPVKEKRTQSVFWATPGQGDKTDLTDESIRIMHFHGQCVVKEAPDIAYRFIDLPFGSPEQDGVLASVKRDARKCFASDIRVKFPSQLLVGPIAEAAIERRFGKGALPALPTGAASLAARNGTEVFAQCVARRNPANVVALIATVPTGPDEGAAVKRIIPDLQPCLTAGTTLRLNRLAIRNLLAIALYRDAAHAAGLNGSPVAAKSK